MTNKDAIEYNNNLREYMKITDKTSEYKFLEENYEALDMGINALKQTRWIPVSEKVPDYGQEVLLFDKNFGYVVGTYEMVHYFDVAEPSFLIHKSIDSLAKASIDPIAWMPLPQLYKEDEK